MISLPKLWKFFNKENKETPQIETYAFENAETLELAPDEQSVKQADLPEFPEEADAIRRELSEESHEEPEPPEQPEDPLEFAKVQSEVILQGAKAQADALLAEAKAQIQAEKEAAREQGRKEGYDSGFQQGLQQGTAKALEENAREQERREAEFGKRIEAFSRSAERALTHQLNENLEGMKELCLAVAEKVVCVSLRSSGDVIAKMIQTAVDKQKRREWVHIYISQGDAQKMGSMPPALASALAALSDHVRIIPMPDDERGTCIVEFPDEIIDASASTQIQNIRELLKSQYGRK